MSLTDAQFLDWLTSGDRRVVLIEAKYHDGSAEQTIYLSQGGYTSGPVDTPANQPYIDIATAPSWQATFADTLIGVSIPAWGDIEILNVEGELDTWLNWSWDNRPLSMWIGDATWSRADFRLIFAGVCTDITAKDGTTHALKIQDKSALFNKPISNLTLGEPELVSGLTYGVSDGSPVISIDAVEDDGVAVAFTANTAIGCFTLATAPVGRLTAYYTGGESTKGQSIPIPLGTCFNITPPLLNSGLHLYRVASRAIQAIDAVRVDGNPTGHTDVLSRATLQLTAAPSGTITADVRGDTLGGVFKSTASDLIKHVLLDYAGTTVGDLDAASFAAFAVACPQAVGTYVSDRANVLDVCDKLLKGVNACLWPDRAGVIHVAPLAVPSGVAKLAITADDLDSQRDIVLRQRVLPAKAVTLKYKPNHSVQTTILSSVSETNAADYRQPFRRIPVRADGVSAIWKGATELEFESCIYGDDDAKAMAQTLLSINGLLWEVWELPTSLAPLVLNLFDVVSLDLGRYGLVGGKLAVVVGITESLLDNATTLKVWVVR